LIIITIFSIIASEANDFKSAAFTSIAQIQTLFLQ